MSDTEDINYTLRVLKYSDSRISQERTVDLTVVSPGEIRHKILPLSPRLKPRSLNGLVKMYLANKTLFWLN